MIGWIVLAAILSDSASLSGQVALGRNGLLPITMLIFVFGATFGIGYLSALAIAAEEDDP